MAAWGSSNVPDSTNPGGIGGFLGSSAGQTLLQSILGGVSDYAKNKQQQGNLEQGMSNNMAVAQGQLGTNAASQLLNDSTQRAQQLNQAAPIGWAQGYEQQQELRNLALQKFLNPVQTYLPQQVIDRLGSSYKPFTPTIPDEWKNLNPFGVDQTMQALGNRQGVLDNLSGGQAPAIDFASLGYDPTKAAALNDQGQQYRQYAAQNYNNLSSNLMNAANISRNPSAQGGSGGSGGGVASRLGGAASGALTGATYGSVVPGIGTAVGAGVGALIGLFKGGGKKEDPNAASASAPIPYQGNALNPYAGGGSIPNFSNYGNPNMVTPQAPAPPPRTGLGGLGQRAQTATPQVGMTINDILQQIQRQRQGSQLGTGTY